MSIISFIPNALRRFSTLPPGILEVIEGVELMRALEHGLIIGTTLLNGNSFSVDVEDDYVRAKSQMLDDQICKRYL